MNHDYYDILSIHPTASAVEIERAYRKVSLKVHPDKASDKDTHAQRNNAFGYINLIKNTLLSPKKRSIYDKSRKICLMRAEGEIAESLELRDLHEHMECRCGGIYEFQNAELNTLLIESLQSGNILPHVEDLLPTLLQCDSCSLVIQIQHTRT